LQRGIRRFTRDQRTKGVREGSRRFREGPSRVQTVQEVQGRFRMVQGRFRKGSGRVQGGFRKDSGRIQEGFREGSRVNSPIKNNKLFQNVPSLQLLMIPGRIVPVIGQMREAQEALDLGFGFFVGRGDLDFDLLLVDGDHDSGDFLAHVEVLEGGFELIFFFYDLLGFHLQGVR
jgi:hypothetical protein